ncbi:ABC transporter ATP-binding protein [Anaeroplasma bactoclasticum]|jgi:ATP-binding cassette subfamily B protein|nr:ABC transporter ATP-binding protein [Anaeroplasma bactoclasticum]
MLKYYLKYSWLYILGIAALVAVDYVQTWIPDYLGEITDIIKEQPSDAASQMQRILIMIFVVAIVMFAGRMLWRFTLFNASGRVEGNLRHEMFLKSEKLSQKYYHENKVGSIMSWFTTDLETIEEYAGFGVVTIVDAFFLGTIVIVKMVQLDWALAIVAFIPMILIIIWGFLIEKFMSKLWLERQNNYDELYDFSQENFTGIRVIKAFVKETANLHAFAKIAKKNQMKNVSFARVSVIFDVLIELIIAAIAAMLLGFGGYAVYHSVIGQNMVLFGHEVTLGAGGLVAFIALFDSLIWPMIAMGQIVSMRSRAKASLKRVSQFLDAEEDIKNPVNAHVLENVSGKITFNHFSFSYPDAPVEVKSLEDVTFEINAGETIGIVGKIGCGKTTLVNSLLRLYNVEKGSILIDGHDIMECDITSLRNAIAYVPQDNFLFSDKIYNNIAFSDRKKDPVAIQNAAIFADVHDNIAAFKQGYDTVSGERGVTLSGGQKQRISIARAYIKESPIMIMDDSVSAVDVKTEETILKNIREKRKGKTTIVIASRVSTVSKLNRILVLNDGKVEAFDTPENLLKVSPTYQRMVYLQELEKEVEGGAN